MKKMDLSKQKIPVCVIASGLGTRMEMYTGNIYPKILCTIGQEVLLSRIIKNIKDICSDLHVIASYKDSLIISSWFDSYVKENGDLGFDLDLFVHDESDGSWNAIKDFANNNQDISKCILHWSDIAYEFGDKIPDVGDDLNCVIAYGSEDPMDCRFETYDDKIVEGGEHSNLFGIYQCADLQRLVAAGIGIESKISKDKKNIDLADILSQEKSGIKIKTYLVDNSKILDNGDRNKHLKIMKSNQNLVRYFNSIEFSGDKVVKTATNERGYKVMADEIEFYNKFKNLQGKVLPKIYDSSYSESEAFIIMEKIDGETVHQKWNNLKGENQISDINQYNLADAVFKSLDLIHMQSGYIDCLGPEDFILSCILDEYYNAVYSRIDEVRYVIDRLPSLCKINVDGSVKDILTDRECLDNMMSDWKKVIAYMFMKLKWAPIHGDPNSKNMMVRNENVMNESYDVVLIDPRGKFGKSKIFGEMSYDFAKFIYGMTSYSNFNHSLEATLSYDEHGILTFDMDKFIDHVYPMEFFINLACRYHNIESEEEHELMTYWYISLIGIIYLKLTGYIKNDLTKSMYAYVYGLYLLDKGLKYLKNKI